MFFRKNLLLLLAGFPLLVLFLPALGMTRELEGCCLKDDLKVVDAYAFSQPPLKMQSALEAGSITANSRLDQSNTRKEEIDNPELQNLLYLEEYLIRFRDLFEKAKSEYERGQFSEGRSSLEDAQAILRELRSIVDEFDNPELEIVLETIESEIQGIFPFFQVLEYSVRFRNLIEKVRSEHARSQFSEAIFSLQEAQTVLREFRSLVSELDSPQLRIMLEAAEPELQNLLKTKEYLSYVSNLIINAQSEYDSGQFSESISSYENALAALREFRSTAGEYDAPELEIMLLDALGKISLLLGYYEKALDFYQQKLVISQEMEDHSAEVKSLLGLGTAHLAESQYDRALEVNVTALTISRDIEFLQGEGDALYNLGSTYGALQQYDRAISFYSESLVILRQLGERSKEANLLNSLGSIYRQIGQYTVALENHQLALALSSELDDSELIMKVSASLGDYYASIGKTEQAIDSYLEALTTAKRIGNRQAESALLGNLGVAYIGLGQYQEAINHHQESLAIARDLGSLDGIAISLLNLGNAYWYLLQPVEAFNFYQEASSIAWEINNRELIAFIFNRAAVFYTLLDHPEQAIDLYQQSISIVQDIGNSLPEARYLGNLGYHQIITSAFSEAEVTLRQAIAVYESLRAGVSDSDMISIIDTQNHPYQLLQYTLVAQSKDAEALTIAEQGRARAFILQLANRFASLGRQSTDLEIAPTVEGIQRVAIDTSSTLVAYSQVSDQLLYIWVVQPSGEITFRSVNLQGSGDAEFAINPITAIDGPVFRSAPDDSELGQLVADSRASIVVESTTTRPEQLRELHTLLIDPIADLLPTDPEAKVVFVPQGNLFLVPFAALQDAEGTYLIEKHTILTAPSIQVYGLANEAASPSTPLRGRRSPSGVEENALIVGNPTMPKVWSPTASGGFAETQLTDLPGAKAEAEAIGGFLNSTPLIGPQATEARVKQLLPSARLIHLATHGLLDYGDPRAYGRLDVPGAIALTPGHGEDGLLTSAEILEMDLQAELAVLSACDTGRGRITGDGVVGLSRALITAGVPSVVVSLWAVPDAPTADLMTEFYRQLDQGQSKAQALRQAMLITMEQHPNPRNWAAFTLIGAAE